MKFEYIKSKEQLEEIFKELPDLRIEFNENTGYEIRSTLTNIKEDGTLEKCLFPTTGLAYITNDFGVKVTENVSCIDRIEKLLNYRLRKALMKKYREEYAADVQRYVLRKHNRKIRKIHDLIVAQEEVRDKEFDSVNSLYKSIAEDESE